jgi:hypothetical protein
MQSRQISNLIELAECFNNYFTDIGPNIAKTIDNSDRNLTDYIPIGRWMRVENVQFRSTPRVTT